LTFKALKDHQSQFSKKGKGTIGIEGRHQTINYFDNFYMIWVDDAHDLDLAHATHYSCITLAPQKKVREIIINHRPPYVWRL